MRSCDIQRVPLVLPLVLLPELLPVDEPLVPAAVPELPMPLDEPVVPAPVSVEVVPDNEPETVGDVDVVVEVVSLVVDGDVGDVVAVVVEPGVALVPELLYELLVPGPLLQPGRAAVARASTAT